MNIGLFKVYRSFSNNLYMHGIKMIKHEKLNRGVVI